MTITLLTATPRSGKTSYAVWHVIKPAIEAGRPVYTCGIPQLKLDTIQVKYEWLKNWSERQYNQELEEDELLNIPNNSLIVIDEAWRLWPVSGVGKPSDDIEYFAMHGHHNIDFLIITQKPNLVHRAVIAQVSRHLHILPTWSGRIAMDTTFGSYQFDTQPFCDYAEALKPFIVIVATIIAGLIILRSRQT